MPRFFFDVADGRQFARDDEGDELPGWREARAYAAGVLTEIANVDLADDNHREFAIKVRDAAGHIGCKATLSIAIERLDGRPKRQRAIEKAPPERG
jgi:hypothetical protein